MKNLFNLKFVTFGAILIVIAYFGITYFVAFNSSGSNLSVENVVKANAVSTPTPAIESSSDFRPDGGFEFSSKPPKAFKDVLWVSVITGSGVGYGSSCAPSPCTPPPVEKRVTWIPQTPRGFLITKDYLYDWRDENLSVDNFSFVTEIHKGQGYKFVGRFLTSGNFEEIKPDDAVLMGHLIKLINGEPVAEEDVTFKWFSWDEVDQQTYLHVKPNSKK